MSFNTNLRVLTDCRATFAEVMAPSEKAASTLTAFVEALWRAVETGDVGLVPDADSREVVANAFRTLCKTATAMEEAGERVRRSIQESAPEAFYLPNEVA